MRRRIKDRRMQEFRHPELYSAKDPAFTFKARSCAESILVAPASRPCLRFPRQDTGETPVLGEWNSSSGGYT